MRARFAVTMVVVLAAGAAALGQKPKQRLNPMIDLLEQRKAMFGVATPSNVRAGGGGNRGGAGGGGAAAATGAAGTTTAPPTPPPAPAPVKTPLELAKDALSHPESDYLFNGSMEYGVDRGIAALTQLADAMVEAGSITEKPFLRLKAPIAVKTPLIAPDPVKAIDNISRELNVGVSAVIFVGVESADEVKQGIAAMRFKSKGGTRPDDIGNAAKYWGMTDAQYRAKADVWPLNPDGELLVWVIVESKVGLAHVKEIAAVPGISVMFPGAGTLGGVFAKTDTDGKVIRDANGRTVRDDVAWEAANQQVLAACKDAHLSCGYPISATDVETRVKQGFNVGVIQSFSDAGFKTLELGRQAGGRSKN